MRVIAYLRVSTDEQAASGLGLAAQRETIDAEAGRRGWCVIETLVDEGRTGASLDRPALHAALGRAAAGDADAIVAARLDRLTRSLAGLADLIEWTSAARVGLVALDLQLDTTTAAGRLVAHLMGAVAEWERELISARTRAAVAVRRARGQATGRPSVASSAPETAALIRSLRARGRTWQTIADELNAAGTPTVRGGALWRISSVQAAGGYRRPERPIARGVLPPLPPRRR